MFEYLGPAGVDGEAAGQPPAPDDVPVLDSDELVGVHQWREDGGDVLGYVADLKPLGSGGGKYFDGVALALGHFSRWQRSPWRFSKVTPAARNEIAFISCPLLCKHDSCISATGIADAMRAAALAQGLPQDLASPVPTIHDRNFLFSERKSPRPYGRRLVFPKRACGIQTPVSSAAIAAARALNSAIHCSFGI